MTEPAAETWHSRDLPLLRRIVAAFQEQPPGLLELDDVADDLTPEQTLTAVHNLRRGGYIEMGEGPNRGGWGRPYITDVTDEALRVTGVWPTPETALERMITALDEIADHTDDTETKTRAQKIRAELATGSKAVSIGLVTALAKHFAGI